MLKIHPVKWPLANLQGKLFKWVNWKLVFSFYLTLLIPLLYILNIILAFKLTGTFNENYELRILGIIIAVFGLIFWILSYINLGNKFAVLPQKQKKVKTGLYKYFNHPMYIGISATIIGISIANSSWQGLVFYNLIILPILLIRAKFEERKLEN